MNITTVTARSTPARATAALCSYRAKYRVITEDAVLSTHDYLLTVMGSTDADITATVDGQAVTVEEAARITRLALDLGTFEKLGGTTEPESVTEMSAPIGKARAHRLHLLLAGEGYRGSHHALASTVLGCEVRHLSELSEDEARRFWTAVTRRGGVAA
jgi:hypothetical protein